MSTRASWLLCRAVSTGLCVLLAPALASGAGTGSGVPEDPTSFFYDARGPRAVTASKDEVLVKLRERPGAPKSRRPAWMGRPVPPRTPQTLSGQRLAQLVERLEEKLSVNGLHVARGLTAEAAAAQPDVEWALPILRRVGSDVPIYPTDQIVVRFDPALSAASMRKMLATVGCELVHADASRAGRCIARVRRPMETNPLAAANALHEMRQVQYAHPDFILVRQAFSPPEPADPLYAQQWSLDGDTLKGALAGSDINVAAAWDPANGPYAEGNPAIRIAILDDSVQWTHPDLEPNYTTGRDYDPEPGYDDDPSPDFAAHEHGTACAGIAVAAANNIGLRGVAPRCGLIGIKLFASTISENADAFYFAMDPNGDEDHSDGAAVISNSWGFADGTLQPPDIVAAIEAVSTQGRNGLGCVVLFAAANSDHTVDGVAAMAQIPSVMCVGGSNSLANHTEFSDVGPELSVVAPTSDGGDDGTRYPALTIVTTDDVGPWGYDAGDYTTVFGGTSASTPAVAGVCALVLSQNPALTAAQVRAIVEHTAVQIAPTEAGLDVTTSHSHRFGYGRVDAGAAVAAARSGVVWPAPVTDLTCQSVEGNVTMTWTNPPSDCAGALVVRSFRPFAWRPTDGTAYTVGQEVAPGVVVVQNDDSTSYSETVGACGFFAAVYSRSALNRYGWGRKTHTFVAGLTLFEDDSEGPDPGWVTEGTPGVWERGSPSSYPVGQRIDGSGPLPGLDGLRAIGGNMCWGTGLSQTYPPSADARLLTPLVDLSGVDAPVFLSFFDWCLLETPYDRCTISVLDDTNSVLGTLESNFGGDYDWTHRLYDLTSFCGRRIRIQFQLLSSDDEFQRDGWFIDDVRIIATTSDNLPPAAQPAEIETAAGMPVLIDLQGSDPNPNQLLTFVIDTLPAQGTLSDAQAGQITQVPYPLVNYGQRVIYTPAPSTVGPDSFTFHVTDGLANSAPAAVSLFVGQPQLVYAFHMDTDPGWIRQGLWQYGPPQGLGSGDPSYPVTGANVIGYNLSGNYPANMSSPEYITVGPLDCSVLLRTRLTFYRWLTVEGNAHDRAEIQVSRDAQSWTTVWSNGPTAIHDSDWVYQEVDIGALADQQPAVYIRWGMGPTDGENEYGGWNIDDVEIWAVAGNLAPQAVDVSFEMPKNQTQAVDLVLSDPNPVDSLVAIITSLPQHGSLSDPNASKIQTVPYTLAGGGRTVIYAPTTGYVGSDSFQYRGSDGRLLSNTATVRTNVVTVAPYPLNETFDSGGALAAYWRTSGTGCGRVRVTSQYQPSGASQLVLDASDDSGNCASRSEATLLVDLRGRSGVRLSYDFKRLNDEVDMLPPFWDGSFNGDGVAFSVDGVRWYLLSNLIYSGSGTPPTLFDNETIDLDMAFAQRGLSYTNLVRIRFQQYGSKSAPNDGIALDNIRLFGSPPIVADSVIDVPMDTTVNITLEATDPEGDAISYVITSLAEQGSLYDPNWGWIRFVPYVIGAGRSTIRYTPPPGFIGVDVLGWAARDYASQSAPATVTIRVGPPDRSVADYDADGDVDIEDFHMFQYCYHGAGYPVSTVCRIADMDGDSDVDISDFGVFQICFNGASQPPSPHCPRR